MDATRPFLHVQACLTLPDGSTFTVQQHVACPADDDSARCALSTLIDQVRDRAARILTAELPSRYEDIQF